MTRHLAEDRCVKRGHLLAWVEMRGETMVVCWKSAELANLGGLLRRDHRTVVEAVRPVGEMDDFFGALATCGCRKDHAISLDGLVRRAQERDTALTVVPRVVPPV